MIWTIWCELFSLCVVWMKNYDDIACLGQWSAHYNNADWDNYSPGIATVLIVNATFNMDMWGHAAVVTSTWPLILRSEMRISFLVQSPLSDDPQQLFSRGVNINPKRHEQHRQHIILRRQTVILLLTSLVSSSDAWTKESKKWRRERFKWSDIFNWTLYFALEID